MGDRPRGFVNSLLDIYDDLPNVILGIVLAIVLYAVTTALDRNPDISEVGWFGLCAAGFWYHWQGIKELYNDRVALYEWPEADDIDKEANANQIRRERARLITKGLFAAAGFIAAFLPPRVVETYELTQTVIVYMLIGAVIALDIDAVMDRHSRRRQIAAIKEGLERRRKRRAILEQQFMPVFELYISETSVAGRQLAHQINNDLARVVGGVELLKKSTTLLPPDQELVTDVNDGIADAVEHMKEMQELVRGMNVTDEYTSSEEP